jgi:hypothetical protein
MWKKESAKYVRNGYKKELNTDKWIGVLSQVTEEYENSYYVKWEEEEEVKFVVSVSWSWELPENMTR